MAQRWRRRGGKNEKARKRRGGLEGVAPLRGRTSFCAYKKNKKKKKKATSMVSWQERRGKRGRLDKTTKTKPRKQEMTGGRIEILSRGGGGRGRGLQS